MTATKIVSSVPRAGASRPSVVVSNGFGRFHLATAAAEADARDALRLLVTGAYPSQSRVLHALGRRLPAMARLVDRRETTLRRDRVRALWWPELAYLAGRRALRFSSSAVELSTLLTVRRYCRRTANEVAAVEGDVFHYRSGFGGPSVDAARRRGMVALCDHSIAHPTVLERLTASDFAAPNPGQLPRSRFWRWVCADLRRADTVLVNSDFVKSTFVQQGWDPARVEVLFLGVDDRFIESLPPFRPWPAVGPARVAFAGTFGRRKGADTLAAAVKQLEGVDFALQVVGHVEPDAARRHEAFFADPRVAVTGVVPRRELARLLSETEIFVFPSLAEGSARVVFEALAAGCFVITTPNAGSIVEDGVHGRLVPPGDTAALASTLRQSVADRASLEEIARRNAQLIRDRYTQAAYGEGLAELYARLKGGGTW